MLLHPWLKDELEAILLRALPPPQELLGPEENRLPCVQKLAGGALTVKVTLPEELPPLRMLVVLDNLTGHKKSPELLLWMMFARGIMWCSTTRLWEPPPG